MDFGKSFYDPKRYYPSKRRCKKYIPQTYIKKPYIHTSKPKMETTSWDRRKRYLLPHRFSGNTITKITKRRPPKINYSNEFHKVRILNRDFLEGRKSLGYGYDQNNKKCRSTPSKRRHFSTSQIMYFNQNFFGGFSKKY